MFYLFHSFVHSLLLLLSVIQASAFIKPLFTGLKQSQSLSCIQSQQIIKQTLRCLLWRHTAYPMLIEERLLYGPVHT